MYNYCWTCGSSIFADEGETCWLCGPAEIYEDVNKAIDKHINPCKEISLGDGAPIQLPPPEKNTDSGQVLEAFHNHRIEWKREYLGKWVEPTEDEKHRENVYLEDKLMEANARIKDLRDAITELRDFSAEKAKENSPAQSWRSNGVVCTPTTAEKLLHNLLLEMVEHCDASLEEK